MSRYKPTKKRLGLVKVTEYARPIYSIGYPQHLIPIGHKWVRKGTVLPVRDLLREQRQESTSLLADLIQLLKAPIST